MSKLENQKEALLDSIDKMQYITPTFSASCTAVNRGFLRTEIILTPDHAHGASCFQPSVTTAARTSLS